MVSEDSDQFVSGLPAVHRLGDLRELLEVLPLGCPERMELEERDDPLTEVLTPPHDVAVQMLAVVVGAPIGDHRAHLEVLTELVQALDAGRTLCYRKLVSNLPSG